MKKLWLIGLTILTMAVGLTACGKTAKKAEASDSGSANFTQEVSSNEEEISISETILRNHE